MPRKTTKAAASQEIDAVRAETGEDDARTAIRLKAQQLVEQFHSCFGVRPPFDMMELASFRGLYTSNALPVRSPDAEIRPDEEGRVHLYVNRNRPATRQQFSIGHEIAHTLFPGYEQRPHCRKESHRDWADPRDALEMLCDIGA